MTEHVTFETVKLRYSQDYEVYYERSKDRCRWASYGACRLLLAEEFVLPDSPHSIVIVFTTRCTPGYPTAPEDSLGRAGRRAMERADIDLPGDTTLWWWVEIIREGK